MAYANGRIPLDLLVHLGGQVYLPPGTAARWRWVVAEGKRRWGVTFYITGPSSRGWDGWNGYRPYDIQVKYKNAFGNMAASPGTSSHGGFYRGQEVFAVDVANWNAVTWSRFSGLMAEAGLRTNFVSPEERWHVGDFNNPWVVPSFAGASPAPVPPPVIYYPEEDNMIVINVNTGSAGRHLCMLGKGVFSHLVPEDAPAVMADITGQKRIFDFDIAHLPRLLRNYGCDPNIWDIRGGRFVVLDPIKTGDQQVAQGNTWTDVKQARAQIAGLAQPQIDTAPVIAAVKAAMTDAERATAADIAKAVNDDVARRMGA